LAVFLSQTELADLTGRRRSSAQIRWLSAQNLRFVLGADGRPRVLRAEVERAMLSAPTTRTNREEPDWSHVA
jgi:hypothetical protein